MPEGKAEIIVKDAKVSELPESLQEDYRKKLGELKNLTKEQEKRLKKFLKKQIESWNQDTDELHRKLEEWNDLAEGVPAQENGFYEDSPNTHVPITETYMDVYGAIIKRSILNAANLWYGDIEPGNDQIRDHVASIDELMNWKARNEWNIADSLSDIIYPVDRDGLAYMQVTWAEEFKKSKDILLITNADEFLQEFPTPDDAGLSPQKYEAFRKHVTSTATEENPIEVPIEFEKRVYQGNKGDIVELANFVMFPAWSPSIKHDLTRGYGKLYPMNKQTLKQKAEAKIFYKEAVDKLIKKKGKTEVSGYMKSVFEHQGYRRDASGNEFNLFELVIWGSLDIKDKDGTRGDTSKLLVTYDFDNDELVQCIDYPYRVDFYAPFRINKRPNQNRGRGIPERTVDMNDEIDRQHNNRMMTNEIANVPSFKGKRSKNKAFDPEAEENRWRPGVIFWLEDPDSFEQFKVQPTDLGQSMAEEKNNVTTLDLYLGSATALLSGGVAPGDPNAPGNKTATMIQQSNLRMDQPLDEFREGVEDVGDICLSHLYQFGPPILEFIKQREENGQVEKKTQTLHKKYIRKGIKMKMSGVTVLQNADAELTKGLNLYRTLMQEPTFAQDDERRVKVLQDSLRNGRVPNREKYLPPMEEVRKKMVEIQKQALEQLQAEQKAQEEEAETQAQDKRLKDANTQLRIKSTAEKIAEAGLEFPETPGGSQ